MLIFGRSPNLTLALLAGAFNLVVSFHVGGFDPTGDQIAQVNAFLFALVAFVANSDTLVRAAGDAAHARQIRRLSETGTPIGTRSNDATVSPAVLVTPPGDPNGTAIPVEDRPAVRDPDA